MNLSPPPPRSSADDGFLELAQITVDGSLHNAPYPRLHLPHTLILALSELLRAASNGLGRIHLNDSRLPSRDPSVFQQYPAFFSIDGPWLMLPRYARALHSIRHFFQTRLQKKPALLPSFPAQAVRTALDSILPPQTLHSPDGSTVLFDNLHQRLAIAALLDANVGILTGGPGTGKTTTAAALLALLKRLQPELHPSTILVTAPTGKAACRIAEAIARAASHLSNLQESERIFLRQIRSTTLHSALEWSAIPPEKGGPFRRGPQRPLDAQILLVDEASMVDLPLMAALVAALSDSSALLLLGDCNQLKSVEIEGLLSELVDRASQHPLPLKTADSIAQRIGLNAEAVQNAFRESLPSASPATSTISATDSLPPLQGLAYGLNYSHRARNAPWILQLADLFRPGTVAHLHQLRELIANLPPNTLQWHESPRPLSRPSPCLNQWLDWTHCSKNWISLRSSKDSAELSEPLQRLGKFQLLCSTNLQVERANLEGIRALKKHASAPRRFLPHGCPILILANHPLSELSNGDIGVALGSEAGGPADLALFQSSSGVPRLLPIAQLPAHAPAFGLTIHKSQGSEWEQVVIELPPDDDSALLTKNLVYTAITRSSRCIHLYGSPEVLKRLLAQR